MCVLVQHQRLRSTRRPGCWPSLTKIFRQWKRCLSNSPLAMYSCLNISSEFSESVSLLWNARRGMQHNTCCFYNVPNISRQSDTDFQPFHSHNSLLYLTFTGLCVDMMSFLRRTKRSPSGPFPVKNPASEMKSDPATKIVLVQEEVQLISNDLAAEYLVIFLLTIIYCIWCICVFERKYFRWKVFYLGGNFICILHK